MEKTGQERNSMAGRRTVRLAVIALIIIGMGALTYLFLWGKLFPYSPVIVGFSKHELPHTVLFVQNGAGFQEFSRVDSLIPSVEEFHQLKFTKKPRIFIFRDRESYLRRTITEARFYAYPNGSLVISPWAVKEAEEGKISLDIYVRHELSHTLLYQHMGILAAYLYYPKWLMEGIAVYSTGQMGTSWYPGRDETYGYIRQGNFMPPQFYKTGREDKVRLDVPYRITFIYSEFACIVDYLIAAQGKEKFLNYMKTLLNNNHHDRVFKECYGVDFDQFLLKFKDSVQSSEKM